MNLPRLDASKNYQGLYIVDFGDSAAVGYTAEEVAILLEQERYATLKVYKLHRLHPDGTMDLKGVSPRRWSAESAFVFSSRDAARADGDFDALRALADRDPPPCRARLLVGRLSYAPQFPEAAALLYPAEYEDEMSAWLLQHNYQGGETCDAGLSHATTVTAHLEVRRRAQLPAAAWRESRSRDEVLKAVGQAIQR